MRVRKEEQAKRVALAVSQAVAAAVAENNAAVNTLIAAHKASSAPGGATGRLPLQMAMANLYAEYTFESGYLLVEVPSHDTCVCRVPSLFF